MKDDRAEITSRMPQRGLAESSSEPRFLVIGKILKPHGVNGEIRVESYSDKLERFTRLTEVYIGGDSASIYQVIGVRFHKGLVIMKLAEVVDRNSAAKLKSKLIQIPFEEADPLKDDEYYLFQIIGMTVFTVEGAHLGELVEIIETKANNVFVINSAGREILIPDIPDVIQQIDFDNGQIVVEPMPGLI